KAAAIARIPGASTPSSFVSRTSGLVIKLEPALLRGRDQRPHPLLVIRDRRHQLAELFQRRPIRTIDAKHSALGIVLEPPLERRPVAPAEERSNALPKVAVGLVAQLPDDGIDGRISGVEQQRELARRRLDDLERLHGPTVPCPRGPPFRPASSPRTRGS